MRLAFGSFCLFVRLILENDVCTPFCVALRLYLIGIKLGYNCDSRVHSGLYLLNEIICVSTVSN